MTKNRHGELSVNDCRGEEATWLSESRAMSHTCEVLGRNWPHTLQPHICWLISFSWISKRRFVKSLCQKVFKRNPSDMGQTGANTWMQGRQPGATAKFSMWKLFVRRTLQKSAPFPSVLILHFPDR